MRRSDGGHRRGRKREKRQMHAPVVMAGHRRPSCSRGVEERFTNNARISGGHSSRGIAISLTNAGYCANVIISSNIRICRRDLTDEASHRFSACFLRRESAVCVFTVISDRLFEHPGRAPSSGTKGTYQAISDAT